MCLDRPAAARRCACSIYNQYKYIFPNVSDFLSSGYRHPEASRSWTLHLYSYRQKDVLQSGSGNSFLSVMSLYISLSFVIKCFINISSSSDCAHYELHILSLLFEAQWRRQKRSILSYSRSQMWGGNPE